MKWRILSVLRYHDTTPKREEVYDKAQQIVGAEEECWEIFQIQILVKFKWYKLLRVSRQRDYR